MICGVRSEAGCPAACPEGSAASSAARKKRRPPRGTIQTARAVPTRQPRSSLPGLKETDPGPARRNAAISKRPFARRDACLRPPCDETLKRRSTQIGDDGGWFSATPAPLLNSVSSKMASNHFAVVPLDSFAHFQQRPSFTLNLRSYGSLHLPPGIVRFLHVSAGFRPV